MKTLYDRLGKDQLERLIDLFYDRVFSSEKIAPLFNNSVKNEVKRKQFLFLCQFLGGPSLYSNEFGHPRMRMRHLPHKITKEAATEWLRCMKDSIAELQIEPELKEELFSCFPMLAKHMINS